MKTIINITTKIVRRGSIAIAMLALMLIMSTAAAYAAGTTHYLRCKPQFFFPCVAASIDPIWIAEKVNHLYNHSDDGDYINEAGSTWAKVN